MKRLGVLAGLVVVVLVTSAAGWGNVAFDGGRTSNSPTERSITPAAARNLRVRWHTNLGPSFLPPVASAGRVFAIAKVGSESELRAYSGATGGCTAPGLCTPLWSVRQPKLSTLVFAGDEVEAGGASYEPLEIPTQFQTHAWRYFGGTYSPASGARTGTTRVSSQFSVVADGCRYGFENDATYVKSVACQHVDLVRKNVGGTCSTAEVRAHRVGGPIAVVGSNIFLLSNDRVEVLADTPNQCAVIIDSCPPLWVARLSSPTGYNALPTVARGRLFVPTMNGDVNVFPAAGCGQPECQPSWIAKAGTKLVGAVALTDSRLFVGSDDGHLYAFRPAGCGAAVCGPTWTADVGSALHIPSVAGDVVYAGANNGRVYAFDARGCGARRCAPLGSAPTGSPVRFGPVISAGRVYVVNDAGDLYALGGG